VGNAYSLMLKLVAHTVYNRAVKLLRQYIMHVGAIGAIDRLHVILLRATSSYTL
jgi:hypothetical protein